MARKAKDAVLVAEPEKQEMAKTLEAPKRFPHEVKHDEMISSANKYAQALNDGETDPEVIKVYRKDLNNAVAAYNLELAHYWYRKWNEESNAVLQAITVRFVPDAVTVKVVKDEESGFYFAEENADAEVKISLPDIQHTLGKGVFARADWQDACNRLAYLYASRVNRRLKDEEGFKYKISEAARKFKFSEEYGSVYSSKFFVHALQDVFNFILTIPDDNGENKIRVLIETDDDGIPYSPAWDYATNCFTKQGKEVGKVILGNPYKMAELIMDAMYLSVTDGKYSTETQKMKKGQR